MYNPPTVHYQIFTKVIISRSEHELSQCILISSLVHHSLPLLLAAVPLRATCWRRCSSLAAGEMRSPQALPSSATHMQGWKTGWKTDSKPGPPAPSCGWAPYAGGPSWPVEPNPPSPREVSGRLEHCWSGGTECFSQICNGRILF